MKEFEVTITRHRNGDIDIHGTDYDIRLKAITDVKSSVSIIDKEGNVLNTVEFNNRQTDGYITTKLLFVESTRMVYKSIPKEVIDIMHSLRRLLGKWS